MSKKLHDFPIRIKLMAITLLTCGVALATAAATVTLCEAFLLHRDLREQQRMLADLIGDSTAQALLLHNQKSAQEALGRLKSDPRVLAAYLVTGEDRVFASYLRKGLTPASLGLELTRAPDGPHLAPAQLAGLIENSRRLFLGTGCLDTVHPYLKDGQKLCTVILRADLGELRSRLRSLVALTLVGMVLCFPIAYLLSARLQRWISAPLIGLLTSVQAARAENYRVRATRGSDDELGELVSGFNELLSEIELRDLNVQRLHAELEEKVAQRTEELVRAKEAAEAASRAKSQFLANMSHEIRTPINGVLGTTQLLLERGLTGQQHTFAEMIKNSGESLLSMINDLLDFSTIEAGKLELETAPFCLRATVEESVAMFAEKAHRKGLELASLIGGDVPDAFEGDHGRLRQILVTLIGNAIKFTERGEVVVEVKLLERDPCSSLLRCEVRDSGIGIPGEAQTRIFELFSQGDGSMTRKFGGTGLGLAIVKQLVELQGGTVGVESREGRGSTFWFELRLKRCALSGAPQHPLRSSLQGLRVLLVDDNITILSILQQELGSLGISCDTAICGEEALSLFYAARSAPYDLAILDLVMPRMDGIELARAIKRDPAGASLKLMMLTSFGKDGDQARAHEAGIECYLNKPVRQEQLFSCIASLMGLTFETAGLPTAKEEAAPLADRSRRILVVEDNPVNREVCCAMLESFRCQVTTAENGRLALAELERNPGIDLVLMDCQMPELDGYQATECIRERERRSEESGRALHLPIVALTAHALEGDRERCLAAGMDEYLTKPLSREKLGAALAAWLPKAPSFPEGGGGGGPVG